MKFRKILIFSLIFLVVSDALLYIGNKGIESTLIVPVSLAAKYLVLINLIWVASKSDWKDDLSGTVSVLFKLLLVWNIITIIRGVFLAHDYWDWKFLFFNSGLFFLIPLAFFIGKSMSLSQATFNYVIGFLFLLGFLAIPIGFVTNRQLYSRLMIPVSFFIVMIPYLKMRYRVLILIVAITSVVVVTDFRTNIIKIVISILILLTWYLRSYISVGWLKLIHFVLIFAPLVLLFLAVTGQFNIFDQASQNDSYVVKDNKGNAGDDESLTADTRTFIYLEVFKTLNAQDSWLLGGSAVAKYKTESFDKLVENNQRYGSEVGFLNTLLYSGIIGVVLYALLLFVVSHNAIYYSNNWLSKMIGLVIISRWLLFFMEEFTQFDLNFYFLWIIIGLVSTKQFRAMTDTQVALYFLNFKNWYLNVFRAKALQLNELTVDNNEE
ncbi:hypothetical protein [Mucilaginibacter gotjawali]|uniref:O-Antigen ligase n=1 Tax=Mucilaginibacter gotjawali TaxID=1550579 RepID=A0A839SAG8_9SPHI|nr:hypothetical protein [Mucilaginibacter gotjawali]MBB3054364.1 hypothetical protein [Mucilaginibacter gotjawali]